MEHNTDVLVWVVPAAVAYGFAYNQLIEWIAEQESGDAYTALLVAFGTLVTLGLSAFIIGWQAALWVLVMFAATGIPMMAGDALRFMRTKQQQRSEADAVIRQMMNGGIDGEA